MRRPLAKNRKSIDFGYVGEMFDPLPQRLRKASVFVMTVSFSRPMYAEIVFDQKVGTWIDLHVRAFEWLGGSVRRVILDYATRHIIEVICPCAKCGQIRHFSSKLVQDSTKAAT